MYPKKIEKGATIGIVALSSPSKPELISQGKVNLEKLGYKVVLGKSCTSTYGKYLSGDDNLRATDWGKYKLASPLLSQQKLLLYR